MDQSELSMKYEKVKHWLQSFDDDDIIPQYEVNEETITFLYNMYEQNKEMNHLSNLLLDDINMKREEYQIEAARLREMLEGVGLPIYALSNAGKSSLKMLCQLASVLNIKDVKKSTYMLALQDFSKELSNVMDEVSMKQSAIDNQITQAKSVLKNLEDMSFYYQKLAEHSEMDIPLTEKRKKEIEKLGSKCDSYKEKLTEDNKVMKVNNIDKQFHHSALVRLSDELQSLKGELKPLQEKYQIYRSLPPDIYLAKVKIEEKKLYIKKLEKELQVDIDFLA